MLQIVYVDVTADEGGGNTNNDHDELSYDGSMSMVLEAPGNYSDAMEVDNTAAAATASIGDTADLAESMDTMIIDTDSGSSIVETNVLPTVLSPVPPPPSVAASPYSRHPPVASEEKNEEQRSATVPPHKSKYSNNANASANAVQREREEEKGGEEEALVSGSVGKYFLSLVQPSPRINPCLIIR